MGAFDDLIPSTEAARGAFDDLIPSPDSARGAFDDLIPEGSDPYLARARRDFPELPGSEQKRMALSNEMAGLRTVPRAGVLQGFQAEFPERAGEWIKGAAQQGTSFLKATGALLNRGLADSTEGDSGALIEPVTPATPEQNPLYRLGAGIESGMDTALPPPDSRDTMHDIARGAGQMEAMVGLGGISKAIGATERGAALVATMGGGVQEFDDAFSRARQQGDDPDTAFSKALGYSTVAGLIENRLGAGRIVRKFFPEPTEAVKRMTGLGLSKELIKNIIAGGLEETSQAAAQDLIVAGQRPTLESTMQNFQREGIPGAVIEGVFGAPGSVIAHQEHNAQADMERSINEALQRSGQQIALEQARPMRGTGESLVANRPADESFVKGAFDDLIPSVPQATDAPQPSPRVSPAGTPAAPVTAGTSPRADAMTELTGVQNEAAQQAESAKPNLVVQQVSDIKAMLANLEATLKGNQGAALLQPNAPEVQPNAPEQPPISRIEQPAGLVESQGSPSGTPTAAVQPESAPPQSKTVGITFKPGQKVAVRLGKGSKEHLARIIQMQPDGSAQVQVSGEKMFRNVQANQIQLTKTDAARLAKADELAGVPADQQAQVKADAAEFDTIVEDYAPQLDWAPGEAYDRNTAMQEQGIQNAALRRAAVEKALKVSGGGQHNSAVDKARALPRLVEYIKQQFPGDNSIDQRRALEQFSRNETQPPTTAELRARTKQDEHALRRIAAQNPSVPELQALVGHVPTRGASGQTGSGPAHNAGRPVPAAELKALRELERLFGVRIILVDHPQGNVFHGWKDRKSNIILLNAATPLPAMTVAGHELGHHIELTHPGLYQDLADALIPLMQNVEKYRAALARKGYQDPRTGRVENGALYSEIINDFIGDNFGRNEFWEDLKKRAPNLFKRLARIVKAWLDKLIAKLKGKKVEGYESEQHFSDLTRARDVVANALVQAAKETQYRNAGLPASDGGLNDVGDLETFSKPPGEDLFGAPESVEEQRARLKEENQKAEIRKQKFSKSAREKGYVIGFASGRDVSAIESDHYDGHEAAGKQLQANGKRWSYDFSTGKVSWWRSPNFEEYEATTRHLERLGAPIKKHVGIAEYHPDDAWAASPGLDPKEFLAAKLNEKDPGESYYKDSGEMFSKPPADDLFGAPESVEEQRARLKEEKQKAEIKKQKEAMQERAGARLTGSDVDTTKEMFGGEVRQDKSGQGSLFSKPERQHEIDQAKDLWVAPDGAFHLAPAGHEFTAQTLLKELGRQYPTAEKAGHDFPATHALINQGWIRLTKIPGKSENYFVKKSMTQAQRAALESYGIRTNRSIFEDIGNRAKEFFKRFSESGDDQMFSKPERFNDLAASELGDLDVQRGLDELAGELHGKSYADLDENTKYLLRLEYQDNANPQVQRRQQSQNDALRRRVADGGNTQPASTSGTASQLQPATAPASLSGLPEQFTQWKAKRQQWALAMQNEAVALQRAPRSESGAVDWRKASDAMVRTIWAGERARLEEQEGLHDILHVSGVSYAERKQYPSGNPFKIDEVRKVQQEALKFIPKVWPESQKPYQPIVRKMESGLFSKPEKSYARQMDEVQSASDKLADIVRQKQTGAAAKAERAKATAALRNAQAALRENPDYVRDLLLHAKKLAQDAKTATGDAGMDIGRQFEEAMDEIGQLPKKLVAKISNELAVPDLTKPKEVPDISADSRQAVPPPEEVGKDTLADRLKRNLEQLPAIGQEILKRARKATDEIKAHAAAAPINEVISYTKNAAETKAMQFGKQASNFILHELNRAFGAPIETRSAIRENALTFYIEAGGEKQGLADFRELIQGSQHARSKWSLNALHALNYAEQHFERFADVAGKYNLLTNNQQFTEQGAGIATLHHRNYVLHLQDMAENWVFGEAVGGGGGVAQPFKNIREHPTYAQALANGVNPKTLNAVDLLQRRLTLGNKLINYRAWVQSMRRMVDPTTNTPIVTDTINKLRADGTPNVTAPPNYKIETFAGHQVAVHSGYDGLFRALTGESKITDNKAGRAAMTLAAGTKHLTLVFDTYHLGRMAFWSAMARGASEGGIGMFLPGAGWKYQKGLTLLDTTPGDMKEMAARGDIPKEWLEGLVEDKKDLNLLIAHGLNVGTQADNIIQHLTHNIPIASRFNKFLFEKYVRGAMSEAALIELKRQRKMNPGAEDTKLARQVARDLNIRFGNLRSESWIKSRTFQDITRFLMLAPQWNESLIRSEMGAVRDVLQAGPKTFKSGRINIGVLGRAAVGALLGTFIANQIINMITRGKPTWENEEEGSTAKLSAWIPDVVGNSPGYFLNPLTLPAEYTHLIMHNVGRARSDWSQGNTFMENIANEGGSAVEGVKDIARGRLSLPGRALSVPWTREGAMGQPLRKGEIVPEMVSSLIPLPIATKAIWSAGKQVVTGEPSERFPGQFEKQGFQTFGIKLDAAPSPEQRIRHLADSFNQKAGVKERPQFPHGNYYDLDRSVRVGNQSEMKSALKELREKVADEDIRKHYNRWATAPFTGKLDRESQFKETLNAEQLQTYEAAKAKRRDIRDQVLRLLVQ